jgi:hypothetical protein
MDRRFRDIARRTLGASRSRRQVLGTAAMGALEGAGAAVLGRGLGGALPQGELAQRAAAQTMSCSASGKSYIRKRLPERILGQGVPWP